MPSGVSLTDVPFTLAHQADMPSAAGSDSDLTEAAAQATQDDLSDLPPSSFAPGLNPKSLAVPAIANGTDGAASDTGITTRSQADLSAKDAPMSRAKRVRAVKFSPAKGPKAASGRRAAATVAAGNIASTANKNAQTQPVEEPLIPNNDFCDSCGGKGHFLCCDGCPRSFHFSCLDPPLEFDEIPAEAWYCKVCEAARRLPVVPKGIFGPLIHKVDTDNPTCFALPSHIRNSFRNVTTGSYGEYVNSNEFRPLSLLGKVGKGGYEDRDPYKMKDKQGRQLFCFKCHEPASQAKQKRIVACDFCELHWHLDCVDPPLVGLPAVTRKWMCPVHADLAFPSTKKLKHPKLIKIKDAKSKNNGDIDILPSEIRFTSVKHSPEELISQGLRYQVPEQLVILDFWSKVRRDKYGHPLKHPLTPLSGTFDFSDSSSLTSMEATPERESNLYDDVSAHADRSATLGAELMDRDVNMSNISQQSREGTEISDGDPPDISSWAFATDLHEAGIDGAPETPHIPQEFALLLSAAGLDDAKEDSEPGSASAALPSASEADNAADDEPAIVGEAAEQGKASEISETEPPRDSVENGAGSDSTHAAGHGQEENGDVSMT